MKKRNSHVYICILMIGMFIWPTGIQSTAGKALPAGAGQEEPQSVDSSNIQPLPSVDTPAFSETTYYVSTSGSDSNPGTESAPWRTIDKAADTMTDGETVIVKAGNYSELVWVEGTNNSFIANGNVTMDGFNVMGDGNLIDGFIITNPDSSYGIRVSGDDNVISNNNISNTRQDGIWFFGSGNQFISNNIHDIVNRSAVSGDPHVDCFQTWGPAENTVIDGNICNHTSTYGSNQIAIVESDAPVRNITFKNNVFIMHDPGYSPIKITRKSGDPELRDVFIYNNTIVHLNGAGIEGISFKNITNGVAVNNVVVDYESAVKISGGTAGTVSNNVVYSSSNLSGVFMDYSNLNFRVAQYSPLINAGATVPVATDFDGVERPKGAGYDIGAFEEPSGIGPTFADVPFGHPLIAYIEALYGAGYTAGCSTTPLKFCPDTILDRAQSAVFMLRGQLGATYSPPPPPWDTFADNWDDFEWAEPWAEGMWQEGLTAGCQTSPLMYCPSTQLPRVEASVFGLRMKYGVNYTPPAGTGTLFADMTDTGYWGIGWAEQAYKDGLLPACGTQNGKPLFCPSQLVNRAWGAYLIVKAKNIPLP